MAELVLLKLFSRKIWVTEKLRNFYTVGRYHTWMIVIPPVARIKRFLRSEWTPRPPATTLKVEYAKIPIAANRINQSPRTDCSSPWNFIFWTLKFTRKKLITFGTEIFLFKKKNWIYLRKPKKMASIETNRIAQWEVSAKNTASCETCKD